MQTITRKMLAPWSVLAAWFLERLLKELGSPQVKVSHVCEAFWGAHLCLPDTCDVCYGQACKEKKDSIIRKLAMRAVGWDAWDHVLEGKF